MIILSVVLYGCELGLLPWGKDTIGSV